MKKSKKQSNGASNGMTNGMSKGPKLSEMDAALLRLTVACTKLQEPAAMTEGHEAVVEAALDG